MKGWNKPVVKIVYHGPTVEFCYYIATFSLWILAYNYLSK